MPASPLVPPAQYKIGLCYYQLSPKPALDQTYTVRAIDEFQAFIEYNPKHEFVPDAEAKISELNGRLAEKMYVAAELYMKLDYYKSASIYYSTVIEKYHDTEFAEPALLGLVKALVARNRYGEAKDNIARFLDKYPSSRLRGEAESLQSAIIDHLKSKSADMESRLTGRGFHA